MTVNGRTDIVGQIRFHPTKGNEGPIAATVVRNGAYAFTTENGPVVGRQLVVFELMVPADAVANPVATPTDSSQTQATSEDNAPSDAASEEPKAPKTLSANAYRSYDREEYIAEQTTTMDFDLK